ncbi:carbamate kinase [Sedimentibacter sp. zth1]|uniref:carbamate kinase n=1 Tax=Sedimentibacter sp. zth1 TaxID=2816908 RepID=UPI001A91AB43|nr:carbamate kinase [Sedimentibacter sp. zth1]QSX05415.1 carbamate kinase [Sedimentibacter sp. zth1]
MTNVTKVVVALGGNALEDKGLPSTAESQLIVVKKTAEYIADLSSQGYEIAIVHGNGPQVGRILLASEAAKDITPIMPFDVCGAMSQGYIGYHIQQGLREAMSKKDRKVPIVSIITQVVVDKNDKAFQNPTKPIGPFYSEEEAKKIEQEKGYTVKEDAGRGYRRVVPSPMPKRIIELETIKQLWDTTIIIACGGGGIPVIEKQDGCLEGVAAVIDKDLAAERLAEDINADILMILTEVDRVCINFNKPDQKELANLSCEEAKKYMEEGHFAPGSMLPKVQAAIKFAESKSGRKAVITSLNKAQDSLSGNSGTIISC